MVDIIIRVTATVPTNAAALAVWQRLRNNGKKKWRGWEKNHVDAPQKAIVRTAGSLTLLFLQMHRDSSARIAARSTKGPVRYSIPKPEFSLFDSHCHHACDSNSSSTSTGMSSPGYGSPGSHGSRQGGALRHLIKDALAARAMSLHDTWFAASESPEPNGVVQLLLTFGSPMQHGGGPR